MYRAAFIYIYASVYVSMYFILVYELLRCKDTQELLIVVAFWWMEDILNFFF